MKYIISESQLDKIMIKYLDSFLLDKDIINNQTSLLVYDGDKLLFTYLPRPRELFTLEDFLDTFETMFNLTRPQALQFILGWFENQFGVTVRKSMTSF